MYEDELDEMTPTVLLQQQVALPRPPGAESLSLGLHQAYCLERAQLLASCYRRDGATNPEIYAAAVCTILGRYPHEVVERVTDPRTGLASEVKWHHVHEPRAGARGTQEGQRTRTSWTRRYPQYQLSPISGHTGDCGVL
jgi:hypothetical protein